MNFAWLIISAALLAQPPQQKSRDLKYEEDRPAAAPVSIPRGYALVIGIAKYKNPPKRSSIMRNATPNRSTPS
jgi:hypothetical protein